MTNLLNLITCHIAFRRYCKKRGINPTVRLTKMMNKWCKRDAKRAFAKTPIGIAQSKGMSGSFVKVQL